MKIFLPLVLRKYILLLSVALCYSINSFGATRTAATTGNWNTAAIWGGILPTDNDRIIIPTGVTVSVTVSNSYAHMIIELEVITIFFYTLENGLYTQSADV